MARHDEGRRCGEDARRSECFRRCQGLRATLTCQKGSAGRECPHRVLEWAECDAEGGRRRCRAETAGRRWWRGRKHVVPASWTHRLTPEGAAEADMGSGGPERHRRRAIAQRRPHLRRRSSASRGGITALHRSRSSKETTGSFQASRRSYHAVWPGLWSNGAARPQRRRRAAWGGLVEAAVRVYGGVWVDVGCWRGPGANYRRGPGVSACEPGRNHGGDRGETRRGRCSAGKAEEGDGTAMRARAVSGRTARGAG